MMRTLKPEGALAIALVGVFIVGVSTTSWAQTVPFETEGPINSVTDNGDGSGSISVMGVVVDIPAGLAADTPSAQLSVSQLADATPLPGRSQPGFIGGTAIAAGNSTGGAVTATSLFVEPAENLIAGEVTGNTPLANGCTLEVQGLEVVFSTDPRIPFRGAINGAGFEIDACTVPVGGAASVEGYFGEDGRFYAFVFESDDGVVADPGDQVSVTRATCRTDKNELEVRGSATQTGGQVEVFDNDTNVLLGSTAVDGVGGYRFRGNVGICPNEVRVEDAQGNFAVGSVDLR